MIGHVFDKWHSRKRKEKKKVIINDSFVSELGTGFWVRCVFKQNCNKRNSNNNKK